MDTRVRFAHTSPSNPTLGPEQLGIGQLFWMFHEAVIVIDVAHYRIVLWNAAAERLLGYSAVEAANLPVEQILPPNIIPDADRQSRTSGGADLNTSTGALPVAVPVRTRDGQERLVEVRTSQIDNANFPGQYVLAILTDVTAQKRLETALYELADTTYTTGSAYFSAVADYLARILKVDYILIGELIEPARDQVRTLALIVKGQPAPAMEYYLAGTPCENVVGRQLCFYPNNVQALFPADRELVELGIESYIGTPLFSVNRDPMGLIVAMHSGPIADSFFAETILRIVAKRAEAELERKRMDEELERRTRELARSNAELEQFAYVASHDLQEPLRAVVSYLQLLERRYRGQLDERAEKYIDYAVDGAERMKRLINDLLSYSRAGRQDRPSTAVDCAALLDTVIADLRTTIDETGAMVTYEPLPVVQGDATQLGQVFLNLIGNALRFRSAAPPRIHISSSKTDGAWLFSIAGQWHRDRSAVSRAHLHHLSAPAQSDRVPWNRDWPGPLQKDHRAPRRPDLGRVRVGAGLHVLLHVARREQPRMTVKALVRPIEILLVEDNPADVDLTREALEDAKVHNKVCIAMRPACQSLC